MGNSIEELVRDELKRQGVPNVLELKDKDGKVTAKQINESLYTSPLITFCEKGLPAFKEANIQYDEQKFVEKVVRVAKEFLVLENENNDSEYLRGRAELDGNILTFLNQIILEPSTHKTIQRQEIEPPKYEEREIIVDKRTGRKEKRNVKVRSEQYGYVAIDSQKFTGIYRHEAEGIHVDALALMHYLLSVCDGSVSDYSEQVVSRIEDRTTEKDNGFKPKTNYQKTLPTYIGEEEKKQLISFKSRPHDGREYAAKFSSSFWRNLYHNVKTCKFNGGDEFIAAMLDCADEHIHHLLLMPETKKEGRKEKASLQIPAEIVAILVDAVDVENGKEYLVVEGVFGTPWTKRDYKEIFCEQTSEEGKTTIEEKLTEEELKLRDFYYGFVYDCILEMALKTKRGVFINYCFSGHAEPPQGSIDFVNYVEQRNKRNPYYGLKISIKDGVNEIRFTPIKEEYKKDEFRMKLRKKESPEVDKLFTLYRRLNTWYEWYKQQYELAKQQNHR